MNTSGSAAKDDAAKDAGTHGDVGARGPLPGWGVPDSVSSVIIDFLGGMWKRGTLSARDRQLITLAVLVALGSREPLQVHVRNGIKGGLSKDDIYEAILQAGAYAGFARATDAYDVTREVLAAHPG